MSAMPDGVSLTVRNRENIDAVAYKRGAQFVTSRIVADTTDESNRAPESRCGHRLVGSFASAHARMIATQHGLAGNRVMRHGHNNVEICTADNTDVDF